MRRIQIYDTTLRDGTQGEGISFSLQDKLLIARRLDELGFDYVEGGYPLSNEKDVEFFAQLRLQPLRRARDQRIRHDAPTGQHGGGRSGNAGPAAVWQRPRSRSSARHPSSTSSRSCRFRRMKTWR